jgi:hypothetical protein
MPVYPIFSRWKSIPIALIDATSYQQALEFAVRRRVSLTYADLKGIRVPGAFLGGADLRGADLSHARLQQVSLQKTDLRTANLTGTILQHGYLYGADLRNASLRHADLRQCNLEQARLIGADLDGALLTGAKLEGATMDWRFSTLAVEILRSDRSNSANAFPIVADLAFEDDSRPYAWLGVFGRHGAQAERALEVLARYVRAGDNAPEFLRRLTADTLDRSGCRAHARASSGFERADLEHCPAPTTSAASPMLWTRRVAIQEPIGLKAV